MKKVLSMFLVLMLCLASAALAVPSKTTGDLITIEATAANGGTFEIRAVKSTDADYAARIATCNAEIAKLKAAASAVEYFGEVKDKNGNPVDLAAVLGTTDVKVNEFCAIIAHGYETSMGEVTLKIAFATPYAAGEQVVVLFGIVGANGVEWTAYTGIGQEDGGIVLVEGIAPETVLAIQEGEALMAVASK